MENTSLVIHLVFLGIGVLVGFNMRNSYAEGKEKLTLEAADKEMRQRLAVAEALNKSLLQDLAYAKRKLTATRSHDSVSIAAESGSILAA